MVNARRDSRADASRVARTVEDTLLLPKADIALARILEEFLPPFLLVEQRTAHRLLLLVLLLGRDRHREVFALPPRPRAEVLALDFFLLALHLPDFTVRAFLDDLLFLLTAFAAFLVGLVGVVKLAEFALGFPLPADLAGLRSRRLDVADEGGAVSLGGLQVADQLSAGSSDRRVGGVAEDLVRPLLLLEREVRKVLLLNVACISDESSPVCSKPVSKLDRLARRRHGGPIRTGQGVLLFEFALVPRVGRTLHRSGQVGVRSVVVDDIVGRARDERVVRCKVLVGGIGISHGSLFAEEPAGCRARRAAGRDH